MAFTLPSLEAVADRIASQFLGGHGGSPLSFPSDLESNGRPIIQFTCEASDTSSVESICLPIPANITTVDSGDYGGLGLTKAAAIASVLQAGLGAGSDVKGALTAGTGAIKEEFSKLGDVGGAMAFLKSEGQDDLSNITGLASGQVINARTNASFTGNQFRTFSFQFSLVPRSRQEADSINNIVKAFRYNTYAKEQNGGKTMLAYPPLWTIKFLDSDMNELEHVPKIFKSYLTTFTSSINSLDNSWRRDNTPLEVNISMSFQESKVLTRDEILSLEENSERFNYDLGDLSSVSGKLIDGAKKIVEGGYNKITNAIKK